MKAHVADYRFRIHCVRIEATNGRIVRFAAYPHDLAMSNGELYSAGSGYEFSGYGASSTFASSSVDFTGIVSDAISQLSLQEISSGVWDGARAYAFATTWVAPIEDEEQGPCYLFGKAEIAGDKYVVQFMALIDALSQSTGRSYAPTCPWTLFDETLDGRVIDWAHSKCTGPRAAQDGPLLADFKVTGTLTSVTDQYMFADSARTEDPDWFAYGTIRFTSGPNAGLKPIQIKAFTAGGVILLHEAMFYLPEVGDAYEMIPGCRKTADACKNKWANKINFGGQDHVPAPSVYQQRGRN